MLATLCECDVLEEQCSLLAAGKSMFNRYYRILSMIIILHYWVLIRGKAGNRGGKATGKYVRMCRMYKELLSTEYFWSTP